MSTRFFKLNRGGEFVSLALIWAVASSFLYASDFNIDEKAFDKMLKSISETSDKTLDVVVALKTDPIDLEPYEIMSVNRY